MKTLLSALLLMFFSFSSQCQDSKSYRVLFLGNSVFYFYGGLCPSFEGFCESAGLDYQAVSQWTTPTNSHGIEFLDYGRIPLNLPEIAADQRIHELIREGNFDYVIIEARRTGYLLPDSVGLPERSGKSIPYEQNLEAMGSVHRTIVESGAQTVIYMHPGSQTYPDTKLPVVQTYNRLHSDLEKMEINGGKHQVILVPALFLWLDAVRHYGVDGWYADPAHGNALARYASACMIYTYLTGEDPRKNSYNKLTYLGRKWEIIPEQSNLHALPKDEQWIKQQIWLYYSTRPR